MLLKVKRGDILSPTEDIQRARVVVGYSKDGTKPLFVIMEHGNAILLSTSNDPEFNETLKGLGVE